MKTRSITANPSQIMVEQLAASGVKYVFYNSGSREARFFDSLEAHPDIQGILALHEGSVASMAGGYTQVALDPAVMVVHLGAGLAQCLGQLINVWSASLPVVVITFAGDTGSYGDKVGLDLGHSVGPTSISGPFTKESWAVIEPDGLPQAIYRALLVAKTPPVGPVHLAVYDRVLGDEKVSTSIIESQIPDLRAGYPSDQEVEQVVRALHDAKRPLVYVGDGAWKSGAEEQVVALAERFGVPIAGSWTEVRRMPRSHSLHSGRLDESVGAIEPDLIISLGVRVGGRGKPQDSGAFSRVKRVIAIGSDVGHLKNIGGLDLAILADERRTIERLIESAGSEVYEERSNVVQEQIKALWSKRGMAVQGEQESGKVRPRVLADSLDQTLSRVGGGVTMVEQYVVTLDHLGSKSGASENVYIRAAGGSEGYGIGGTVGVKLAAPDRPVAGLVGDGSMFYSDSGMWTAAHHRIPVLYVISNNQSYGIVASSFGRAGGLMKTSGEYAGVVLDGIDPVKIAEGFGLEAQCVSEESELEKALTRGMDVVVNEGRPYLLDVRLPLGVPQGGRAAAPFQLG